MTPEVSLTIFKHAPITETTKILVWPHEYSPIVVGLAISWVYCGLNTYQGPLPHLQFGYHTVWMFLFGILANFKK